MANVKCVFDTHTDLLHILEESQHSLGWPRCVCPSTLRVSEAGITLPSTEASRCVCGIQAQGSFLVCDRVRRWRLEACVRRGALEMLFPNFTPSQTQNLN